MDTTDAQFIPGVLLNGRYETVSPLNHGSFGMVFMAKDMITTKHVALKCMAKSCSDSCLNSGFKVDERSEELKIHAHIGSHPNIVNLLDSFETETHAYLVLEYCSMGDLYEAIRQDKGPKQTDHIRSFMFQLIDAIETLHRKGIYHRDIKPENIFLTGAGDMKLGDFGLATTDSWSHEIAVGSDRYMAPEQFDPQGHGLSPAKADIWSVGICLLNILFSRNPFGEPSMADPLFSDFVRDRQSLFDVFPNLSQDTFEVLIHCLAIDPEKRSLSLMRDALDRVISFTIDDDILDDFCTENREVLTATAHREPLRTPSVVSPSVEPGETFPWARALHMTTPSKHTRKLSVIHDADHATEDLFPGSEASARDWVSKAETRSIESVVDSGLGLSMSSYTPGHSNSVYARSKPMPIAGSLPAFSGRARDTLSSIFGRKKAFESKSWSDLWDEEEEEKAELEREKTIDAGQTRVSQLSQIDSESEGRSTPRALAEVMNPNGRPVSRASIIAKHDDVSQNTGFVFEDATPTQRYSPPSKRSLADKWAALGDKRRGSATTSKELAMMDPSKKRFSPWRRNFAATKSNQASHQKLDHDIWKKKEWNLSTDWRRSDHHLPRPSPLHNSQLDGTESTESLGGSDHRVSVDFSDGEPEWVGGWKDLHL